MHKINPFKTVVFCLLFLACTSLFAEKSKSLSQGDVFDYTTCAAFFAVIAGGMEAGTNANKQFTRMSEKMNDYAISLPSDGYSDINEDEVAKKLQEEINKSEDSAKKVVRLYSPHCKKLYQAIADR